MRTDILRLLACLGLTVFIMSASTGCEDEDHNHTPPEGQGSLIIENHTEDNINIYVDGAFLGRIGDYSDSVKDLEPGVHRIIFAEDDGDRDYSAFIDIIEGTLTVADIYTYNSERYTVDLSYEN